MGLFPEFEKKDKKTTHQFDYDCSKILNKALEKKGKLKTTKASFTFFKKLRTSGVSEDRIKKVLDWYILHIGEEYIPEAFSAEFFWKKFQAIEICMEKREKRVLSSQAQIIYDKLKDLYWPKGSLIKLSEAIEISLENYTKFLSKTIQIYEMSENKRMVRIIRRLMDNVLSNPNDFIFRWFKDANEQICEWENWNGNLRPYYINMNMGKFHDMISDQIWIYCKDSTQWTILKEMMG